MRSFEEFWPYYVRAHSNKVNRSLHFAGTTAGAALVAAGILTLRPSLVLAGPVVGYGCAWIGHFFVEGNVPASFGHPWWSFKADWVMWKKILEGTMDDEVERVLRDAAPAPKGTNGRPTEQPS
ncbi:MAG: DUF962 domain-containing protein [Deltaproteobacteria bacterium]|nr:DUF962 domain-containing protein [Deltaproteobacteria bacterium]